MEIPSLTKLEERVYRAAEAALVRQHYVSTIDVLCGRLLAQGPHRFFGVRDSGKPEQDLFVHSDLPPLGSRKGP